VSPSDIQKLIDKYGLPAWEAAQRQVWVDFWTYVAVVFFSALATIGLVLLARRQFRNRDHSDPYDDHILFGGLLTGAAALPAIGAIICAISAARILANPTWAAVQILASLLPGSGS